MVATLRATLPALDDANLGGILHGLRESIETARLAGNAGMGDFYDALAALADAERDRRRGGDEAGDGALLLARVQALGDGELLVLAMHTTLETPPGVPPSSVAFVRAVAALLNDECRRRVGYPAQR